MGEWLLVAVTTPVSKSFVMEVTATRCSSKTFVTVVTATNNHSSKNFAMEAIATNNFLSSKNFAMEAIATKCHASCKNFTNLKTLPTGSLEINAIKKLSQLTSWLRSSRLQSTDSPVDASLVDTPKLADPSPPPLPLSVMLFLMNSPCQP